MIRGKRSIPVFRLSCIALLSLLVACGLAVHSASIALGRSSPDTSVRIFPANGLALEELASRAFVPSVQGGWASGAGLAKAKEWAFAAYEREPLTPEAHAIIAFAEQEDGKRKRLLDLSSNLNRRDMRLQAAILQENVKAEDYEASIATLDRILRVRPSRSSQFFPILLPIFVRDNAVDQFENILDGTSTWHKEFIQFALSEPNALLNLLELRKRGAFDDREIDRRLLWHLANVGQLDSAYDLYQQVLSSDKAVLEGERFNWDSRFPPFDWEFSEHAGMRAQPDPQGNNLEIAVQPGMGGVVARRVFRTPDGPFVIDVNHNIQSSVSLNDIDIVLMCVGTQRSIILERQLASKGGGFEIENLSNSCSFIEIALQARAWSGRSPLFEEIRSILLKQPRS